MSKDDWSVRSRKKKMPCEICKKRSHSTETCWYQANNDSCERCSKYEKDLKDLVSEKESLERDKVQGKNVSVKLRKTIQKNAEELKAIKGNYENKEIELKDALELIKIKDDNIHELQGKINVKSEPSEDSIIFSDDENENQDARYQLVALTAKCDELEARIETLTREKEYISEIAKQREDRDQAIIEKIKKSYDELCIDQKEIENAKERPSELEMEIKNKEADLSGKSETNNLAIGNQDNELLGSIAQGVEKTRSDLHRLETDIFTRLDKVYVESMKLRDDQKRQDGMITDTLHHAKKMRDEQSEKYRRLDAKVDELKNVKRRRSRSDSSEADRRRYASTASRSRSRTGREDGHKKMEHELEKSLAQIQTKLEAVTEKIVKIPAAEAVTAQHQECLQNQRKILQLVEAGGPGLGVPLPPAHSKSWEDDDRSPSPPKRKSRSPGRSDPRISSFYMNLNQNNNGRTDSRNFSELIKENEKLMSENNVLLKKVSDMQIEIENREKEKEDLKIEVEATRSVIARRANPDQMIEQVLNKLGSIGVNQTLLVNGNSEVKKRVLQLSGEVSEVKIGVLAVTTDVNKTRREIIQYVADNEEECPCKKRKTDEGL